MTGGGGDKKVPTAQLLSPKVNLIIAATSSLSTNLVLYPLDLIKVKLQGTGWLTL